jgi:hypothetical protein
LGAAIAQLRLKAKTDPNNLKTHSSHPTKQCDYLVGVSGSESVNI